MGYDFRTLQMFMVSIASDSSELRLLLSISSNRIFLASRMYMKPPISNEMLVIRMHLTSFY